MKGNTAFGSYLFEYSNEAYLRKDIYDYFSQDILVVLRSVGSLYTSIHILCLIIAMPIGYASLNVAVATEFYKTDQKVYDELDFEPMSFGLWCHMMRLFCIGGSLDRDDKVDDEELRYDEDGNPTFEPYVKDG